MVSGSTDSIAGRNGYLLSMSDLSIPAPRRPNRANWVGLRTLRQIPRIVGETDGGEPIYLIRSARLLLRGDASHFNRIVTCSKCERDVTGPPVMSPLDLDHQPTLVICGDCVKASTIAYATERTDFWAPPRSVPAPAPVPVQNGHSFPGHVETVVLDGRRPEFTSLIRAATEESGRQSTAAHLVAGPKTLAGAQQELARQRNELAERPAQNAAPGAERLQAMEDQLSRLQLLVVAEAGRRSAGVEAQQSELRAAVEANVEQLRTVVRHDVGQARADMAQVMLENEQLMRSHEALVQRLDSMAKHVQELHGIVEAGNARHEDRAGEQAGLSRRLDEVIEHAQRLQARIDSDTTRAHVDPATVSQMNVELVRIEEQFNQRLDRLAERAARTDDLHADRLRSLDEQTQKALAGIGEALESRRQELQTGLRQELADVRASISAQETASESRVQALEERLRRSDDEMSELGELHAVIDVGLGTLRSEVAEVRGALTQVAGSHADIQDRLDGLDRPPQGAPPEQGRGRKFGRKNESGAHLAVAIDAAELLVREHQQLKVQVARLEQEADAATARAASQASATAPLKSDIRLLQEQLAAHNDALGTLGRAVERLRRKVSAAASAPAPTTKPGRRPSKT